MLISSDIYFKTVFEWLCIRLLLKNGDFVNTDISQGSVATRLGCGGVIIYISPCYKFTTESNSERIVKISKYLVKLWMGKRLVSCFFLTHGVVTGTERQNRLTQPGMNLL